MSTTLNLAITTIGDLLVNRKITRNKENNPINDINLIIPDYQRPYKWTPKNAIQLLDDIIEAKSENKEVYRVGTLILHQDENNNYNIVDGQQRVITFSLLLSALGEQDISFLNQELSNNDFNSSNIPNNYQAFCRRLGCDENDPNRKRENENILAFIKEQCELIIVITNDISEAFQFFDSQNARGKSLYPHDLLKAFHLREMENVDEIQTEKIVQEWEDNNQTKLASFFGKYLYRIKGWINGNRHNELTDADIHIFKGLTKSDRSPFAQFYKAAFAYSEFINNSAMPFVTGMRNPTPFQLNAPIIAGKPFFDYTNHYFSILKDIQDNSKYRGFYINDNPIVKTLDTYFNYGTGNGIARLMFDTAVLLFVDRFCPSTYPSKSEMEVFDRFVIYAFIWAYSIRAQQAALGWATAHNYILEEKDVTNSINIYKLICQTDSAILLLSILAEKIRPIKPIDKFLSKEDLDVKNNDVYVNYLHYFKKYGFLKN